MPPSDSSRANDSSQLARQWALLRLLSTSGRSYSVKELADQLGTSKPTIQRDLDTLRNQFALVEEQAGKQKKIYRIDESIKALDSVQFGTMELLALHAAASSAILDSTPFSDDLKSVIQKLRGFLSPRHNGGIDALARVFAPHRRVHIDYGEKGEIIDDLSDAIAKRRYCVATYRAAASHAAGRDEPKDHRFKPLKLVWHKGALYLLCSTDKHKDVTTLAVQRIAALEVTGEEFQKPRLDTEGHLRKAFGIFVSDDEEDVEIVFSKDIAWRIEEQSFHPDEEKSRGADGSLVYRIKSSAQWEVIPWVLSFGPLAELQKPASWRASIAEAVHELSGTYETVTKA